MQIERLNQPGILAGMNAGGELHFFTTDAPSTLSATLTWSLRLAELSNEPVLVKLAQYSVRVARYGDDVLAVAYWNGSPVVKSLTRMMRKAMGRPGRASVARVAQAVAS